MEIKEFFRIVISGLMLLSSVVITCADKRFPLEGNKCTSRDDIPVIKVISYTTVVPLEDASTNHIIYSSFSMARRRLLKEDRPVQNVTEHKADICLGEGGLKEWSVPVSNKSSYITEVVIECFDQGLGPVEFEYNGIGVKKSNPLLPYKILKFNLEFPSG
jgi:hypothetical protein